MAERIYVCANHETIGDGIISDQGWYQDEINEAISAVRREIGDIGYDDQESRIFSEWHGGKFDSAGVVIGSEKFGYRSGFVATLQRNPSAELEAAVDKASSSLDAKLRAIGRMEDEQLERERKEAEEETE